MPSSSESETESSESEIDSPQEKFSKDVMKMLMNGTGNDVTIVLKDGEVKANKDLLRVRSPYFETMFNNNNFVESQTNTIKMMTVKKKTMIPVLHFLFSGDLDKLVAFPDKSLLTRVEILDLLRFLILDQPYDYVENNIEKDLKVRERKLGKRNFALKTFEEGYSYKIIQCMRLARALKIERIYKKCLNIMCKHIEVSLKCSREIKIFQEMSMEEVKAFLENPVGDVLQKIKAFKVWFESNKEELSEEEKIEALKFQLNYVIDTLDNNYE